jgi:hypothetical protein
MTESTQRPLLSNEQSAELSERWQDIQASFVDTPQKAVEAADALVSDLMGRITNKLAAERQRLEQQWSQGEDASTEDLRVTLTSYRTFFDKLLSA